MENEQSSASLWANPDSFSPLLDKARQFAGEYLDTLEKRPVFPTEDSLKAMNMLDEPLPQSASDPVLSLKLLHEIGSHAAVAQTSGRYFGFVNGGIIPVGLAAKWLADVVGSEHRALCDVANQLASGRNLRTLDRFAP